MILLIDNYDSFTYNLVHYFGELGAEVVVRRNDALDVQEAMGMGADVRAPEIVHGKMGEIRHQGKGVFEGLPSPLLATRYHSLVVDRDTLPNCLEITAELDNGLIMGLRHKELEVEGVQFHPESIRSEHGHAMLKNFLDKTKVSA